MFSITLNPTSPADLAEYLAVIKASGLGVSPTVNPCPTTPGESLSDKYKRLTGKKTTSLSRADLLAGGWDGSGEVTQADKDNAMRHTIGQIETPQAENVLTEETGAVYEPEGEIPEPDASGLDY